MQLEDLEQRIRMDTAALTSHLLDIVKFYNDNNLDVDLLCTVAKCSSITKTEFYPVVDLSVRIK